jgi:hypothetical protein
VGLVPGGPARTEQGYLYCVDLFRTPPNFPTLSSGRPRVLGHRGWLRVPLLASPSTPSKNLCPHLALRSESCLHLGSYRPFEAIYSRWCFEHGVLCCLSSEREEGPEVVALSFSGGGAGMGAQGPMGPMGGMMMGASTRRGISDITWHPDNVCYSVLCLLLAN